MFSYTFSIAAAQGRLWHDITYKMNKSEYRACSLCACYTTLLIRKTLFPDNLILCITEKKLHQMVTVSSAVGCAEAYEVSCLLQTLDKCNLCLQTLEGMSWLIVSLGAMCAGAAKPSARCLFALLTFP